MSQILNKLIEQKLEIDNNIKKIYKNIKSNENKINELIKRIKIIKKGIHNRKRRNKNYNDLSLAISEIRNDIGHYKNDTIILNDRILEFESIKDNILLRIEKVKIDLENMKQNNTIRCEDCNIDIHRASYSRHLKSKKHLDKNNIKPKKVIDKDNKKVTKKNNKIEYKFTDEILDKIYDITIDRHHKKKLNSQITITLKFDNTGIEMYFIDKIFREMAHIYSQFINQYKLNINYHLCYYFINLKKMGILEEKQK